HVDLQSADSLAIRKRRRRVRLIRLLSYNLVGRTRNPKGVLSPDLMALAAAEDMNERMFEAELHRIIGDALLSMQRQGEAEVEFTRALAVAGQQKAKSWELRAAMSLARLWRDQGKVQQAVELLAPIYGWFTEGFD